MTDPTKIIDLQTSNRPKVLVAEDEQEIASLIEDWLSETYDVTVALNGKTAVQKAIWHQPSAILLDVVMPDMGGYDVVRLLQGAPQTKDIPVIVMTAKNFDDSTVKMIKAEGNVCGFLNKPFKPSELIKLLETIVHGKHARVFEDLAPTIPSPPPSPVESPPSAEIPSKTPDKPLLARPPALSGESGKEMEKENLTFREKGKKTGSLSGAKIQAQKGKEEEASYSAPKRWVSPVVKVFVSLFFVGGIILGGAEWVCRRCEQTLGTPFFTPPIYPSSRYNSFLPYQWRDSKDASPSYWGDGKAVYQFNPWGLRGPDFPLVAPKGVRRVLLLGGTFSFGVGLNEKETIASRLEALLNEKRPGSFQVVNGGLWAASPDEQWGFLKGQGLSFKPEVILWLCENRLPGTPSTEGLRWLASRRWLVLPPFSDLRLIQMLVQSKIQGGGDPVPKEGSPLFREAEKAAKEQKAALLWWILPSGGGSPSFQENLLGRLVRAVEDRRE